VKRGTENLLKFKHLMRDLDLPEYAALGLLQSLWMKVDINCPAGDVGRFSDEDIALLVDWRGDPGALVSALLRRGWLDEHPEHRLVVHDWADHCEDTTHRKLARARAYFADGRAPNTCRLGKDQGAADAFYAREATPAATVRTACARDAHAVGKNGTACAPTDTDTDTDTEALADTDTEPKPGRAPVSGSAFSDSGSGSASGAAYRRALWKRLQAVTVHREGEDPEGRDPPSYVDWWRRACRLAADSGGLGVLEEAVKYVEDCRDPAVRRAKDLGELKRPPAFIAGRLKAHLASCGQALPPPPPAAGMAGAGAVGAPARTGET
jgi:hypothetical protein